jgi:hypothetical protein
VSRRWKASLDAAKPAPIAFDAEGRFTLPTAFALDGSADGVHTLTLTATDARGNASAPFTLGFTLDTRAPVITLTSIADGDALSADSRLAGTADPSGSTLISLTYAFDGGQKIPVSFDAATGQFDTAFDLARNWVRVRMADPRSDRRRRQQHGEHAEPDAARVDPADDHPRDAEQRRR